MVLAVVQLHVAINYHRVMTLVMILRRIDEILLVHMTSILFQQNNRAINSRPLLIILSNSSNSNHHQTIDNDQEHFNAVPQHQIQIYLVHQMILRCDVIQVHVIFGHIVRKKRHCIHQIKVRHL